MSMRINLIGLMTATAFMGAGCSTGAKVLGIRKSAPNEFNILTKPPLIVPPEYNLRPPRTGELNIEEKYSTVAARKALLGEIDPAKPSAGEAVLIAKAGGGKADPTVRALIDASNSIERKNRGFADRVMFWKNGKAIGPDGQPLDPDSEERRMKAVKSATGDKEVKILRRPRGAKLPGL
ncbi:MAG TPA: DUF3035 domain-containing protein [Hellea balneolensis]|uniref:DUF3035 domain-containing protein n=1 Tax=Hellea balneolensis TaxID=287478 RepID=A0A7C3FYY1_9PROT|nr:DUF3035 domain-containing protein [Hellea balneolensis]